jgi:hypothetical protein
VGGTLEATVLRESIREGFFRIKRIVLLPGFLRGKEGTEGAFVLPRQSGVLCTFGPKKRGVWQVPVYNANFREGTMPMFGMVNGAADGGVVITGIITAGEFNTTLVIETGLEAKESGEKGEGRWHCLSAAFDFREHETDAPLAENMSVRFVFDYPLKPSWVQVAKRYREYRMKERGIRTLREREAGNPVLAYGVDALPVRLRLAWKPCPGTVAEQTADNEPPLKVAITFDRVRGIADAFRAAGIARAEFCLVGWNSGGHDGRFPQNFPVEPALGCEASLRRCIRHVMKLGYQITAHDNYYDAYSVADSWDAATVSLDHKGEKRFQVADKTFHDFGHGFRIGPAPEERGKHPLVLGGGLPYLLCARAAFEKYVLSEVPKIRALGFRGAHFSDVLSIEEPDTCHHPDHPLTRRGCAEWRNKALDFMRGQFGAVSSEGLLDFTAGHLDRAMYLEESEEGVLAPGYADKSIPLLPFVYHGILHYNLSFASVNCVLKERDVHLRCAEYGGVPLVYFYSGYRNSPGQNWMGRADLTCATQAGLDAAIASVKRTQEMFCDIIALNRELMEDHVEITPTLRATTYANGRTVFVNYADTPAMHNGVSIPAKDFVVTGEISGNV